MPSQKPLINQTYLTRTRQLRKKQTPWEAKLWGLLRANRFYGLPFKRQMQIGPYIADFVCLSKMVVVELDGGQHSVTKEYDAQKDQYLKQQGYTVVRVWNNEVDRNLSGVLTRIKEVCCV